MSPKDTKCKLIAWWTDRHLKALSQVQLLCRLHGLPTHHLLCILRTNRDRHGPVPTRFGNGIDSILEDLHGIQGGITDARSSPASGSSLQLAVQAPHVCAVILLPPSPLGTPTTTPNCSAPNSYMAVDLFAVASQVGVLPICQGCMQTTNKTLHWYISELHATLGQGKIKFKQGRAKRGCTSKHARVLFLMTYVGKVLEYLHYLFCSSLYDTAVIVTCLCICCTRAGIVDLFGLLVFTWRPLCSTAFAAESVVWAVVTWLGFGVYHLNPKG